MTPRRHHDPYSPHPPRPRPREHTAVPSPPPPPPAAPDGQNLEGMRKADLVALAGVKGLDTAGTRRDLITRLKE
ncbi:MAG: SAP domain-containing protein [Pseudonocardiaceae bacterium]